MLACRRHQRRNRTRCHRLQHRRARDGQRGDCCRNKRTGQAQSNWLASHRATRGQRQQPQQKLSVPFTVWVQAGEHSVVSAKLASSASGGQLLIAAACRV